MTVINSLSNFEVIIVLNKLILKYEPDLDFVLIAITVPLKDYRFCYRINQQLDIQFYRIDDLELQPGPENVFQYFSRYYYQSLQTEIDFYLLANKGSEGFLIPEMKKTDFFVLIRNYIDNEDLDRFLSGITRIGDVISAAEVDPKKLKSKENLIF